MNKTNKKHLASIELTGKQIEQAYYEAKALKSVLPKAYFRVNKVVVAGMGGSQLGVDLVRYLFADKIRLPIIQVRGYKLPNFVDSKTLVILSSYSGNTEEVLAIARLAKKARAKTVAICSGGRLATWAKKNKIPAYIFRPINNPSKQPRLGISYATGAVIRILKILNMIEIKCAQVDRMVEFLGESYCQYSKSSQLTKLADRLKGKIPIYITSEFLKGNGHIITNQTNESAKQLAYYHYIPELNHHLLEGMIYPKNNSRLLHFVFFNSDNYLPRNQKRYKVTQQILRRYKILYTEVRFGGSRIEQSMAMLIFGGLLSYQLAKLNKVDPNKIPWVDYFKKKLKG